MAPTSVGAASGGPIVSVPSGNFGNLTAGLIAKRIGLPIRHFVAATNVNDSVPVYLHSGHYEPRPSIPTVANAMDVGAPEQLRAGPGAVRLGSDRPPPRRRRFRVWRCPSGGRDRQRASASRLRARSRTAPSRGWRCRMRSCQDPDAHGVFLATAHPAKFREIVEPAIGRPVPLPPEISDALSRPRQSTSMPADYAALERFLRS